MTLSQVILHQYRAASGTVILDTGLHNVIVGRNDAGKSVVLKALDLFFNDVEAIPDIRNIYADSDICSIELHFDDVRDPRVIDESVQTTWNAEEMLSDHGQLCVKKVWDASKQKMKPDTYILRKRYDENDFLLLTEKDLMKLCKKIGISTSKANGEDYNNAEKRAKIRRSFWDNDVVYDYHWEKLASTGTSRSKMIFDALKSALPRFEYFHADASLSESDTAIQKYFKSMATSLLGKLGIDDVEKQVEHLLENILRQITDKVNQVLPQDQAVEPEVSFNWGNVVSTGFRIAGEDTSLPLSFRGDGFRRVTMMSYFEYLAEESHAERQNIIFGFEEPETFLHPAAQEQLIQKLQNMSEAG